MNKLAKKELKMTAAPSVSDIPLIELSKSNPALRKLISVGKERGYISYDELNEALPQAEMTSEQIVSAQKLARILSKRITKTAVNE